ncbi:MAG TPA: outer membrane lipoprotein carrier protein LolA [Rhizobiaceae bacterium]|nr:outer membrane lipoprotein carrier protein LolA [Rhizobiaceae bacterium]
MTTGSKPARGGDYRLGKLHRRAAMGALAAFFIGVSASAALATSPASDSSADYQTAQKIADHFSSIKTMEGEFVQFGPRGDQVGGHFYIERPGRLRFDYDTNNNFKVIADGRSVAISNPRMKTWNLYPLDKTPLTLLLANKIDLSGNKLKSVKQGPDLITVKLSDRSVFGNSLLTMMFDPKSYALRQWTITDPQGKDTTVMIFNVKDGVSLDPSLFTINYAKIQNKYNSTRGK